MLVYLLGVVLTRDPGSDRIDPFTGFQISYKFVIFASQFFVIIICADSGFMKNRGFKRQLSWFEVSCAQLAECGKIIQSDVILFLQNC